MGFALAQMADGLSWEVLLAVFGIALGIVGTLTLIVVSIWMVIRGDKTPDKKPDRRQGSRGFPLD
ncbi:MAG: hypothetical protein JWL69_4364 [Phycisphaerales bacterium]|nr:hypothetical protein [Phycisphaerales bacterium]